MAGHLLSVFIPTTLLGDYYQGPFQDAKYVTLNKLAYHKKQSNVFVVIQKRKNNIYIVNVEVFDCSDLDLSVRYFFSSNSVL